MAGIGVYAAILSAVTCLRAGASALIPTLIVPVCGEGTSSMGVSCVPPLSPSLEHMARVAGVTGVAEEGQHRMYPNSRRRMQPITERDARYHMMRPSILRISYTPAHLWRGAIEKALITGAMGYRWLLFYIL